MTTFRKTLAGAALLLGCESASVQADPSGSLFGRWLTQDHDGVIEIYRCGSLACGRIVGMSEITRPNGSRPVDPQGRPQCGLTILRQTSESEGVYQGTIINPDDGSLWNCEFWLEPDGLHLRGYVLVPLLGRTQVWHRYDGSVTSNCTMANG